MPARIPWFTETLDIPSDEATRSALDAQYGRDADLANGWSSNWHVIAQDGGDPIFVDGANGKVCTAVHGVGSWTPITLAGDLRTFKETLQVWIEVIGRHGNTALNDDDMPDLAFREDLLATLRERGLDPTPMDAAWNQLMSITP